MSFRQAPHSQNSRFLPWREAGGLKLPLTHGLSSKILIYSVEGSGPLHDLLLGFVIFLSAVLPIPSFGEFPILIQAFDFYAGGYFSQFLSNLRFMHY